MKKIIVSILLVIGCVALVGCASLNPQRVIKKGSRYVRDRENDYHTSYFVPRLAIPEGLSPFDENQEQLCPKGALPGKTSVNIEPPGIF